MLELSETYGSTIHLVFISIFVVIFPIGMIDVCNGFFLVLMTLLLIHIFAMTDSTNLISGQWSSGLSHNLYDHPFFYNEIVTLKEQCPLLNWNISSVSSTSWGIYDDN